MRLAVRVVIVLAVAIATVASCARDGDLSTASRAAICPGDGDEERVGVRGGDSVLFLVKSPILSFTEPTSGP